MRQLLPALLLAALLPLHAGAASAAKVDRQVAGSEAKA